MPTKHVIPRSVIQQSENSSGINWVQVWIRQTDGQVVTDPDQNMAAAHHAGANNTEALAQGGLLSGSAPADRGKHEASKNVNRCNSDYDSRSHASPDIVNSTPKKECYMEDTDDQASPQVTNQLVESAQKSKPPKNRPMFTANESTLPSPEWNLEIFQDCNQNRTCWVSPVRKIAFKLNRDALVFEMMKQKVDGDEFEAWIGYTKRCKRLKVPRRVIGSKSYDIVTTPKGTHDMSVASVRGRLESFGWIRKDSHYRNCTRWLSPDYKIQFLWMKVAYEFEILRQDCHGDESKALGIFFEAKQKAKQRVSDFIHGGRLEAELLVKKGGRELDECFAHEDSPRTELPQTRSKSAAQITGKHKKGIQGKIPEKPIDSTKLPATPKAASASSKLGRVVTGSPNPIPKTIDLGFFYRDGPRRKTLSAEETRESSARAGANVSATKKRKRHVSSRPRRKSASETGYDPSAKERNTRTSSNM